MGGRDCCKIENGCINISWPLWKKAIAFFLPCDLGRGLEFWYPRNKTDDDLKWIRDYLEQPPKHIEEWFISIKLFKQGITFLSIWGFHIQTQNSLQIGVSHSQTAQARFVRSSAGSPGTPKPAASTEWTSPHRSCHRSGCGIPEMNIYLAVAKGYTSDTPCEIWPVTIHTIYIYIYYIIT